jgi:hypothetical protein
MAQIEANLLAEDWAEALTHLKTLAADSDLRYFSTQLDLCQQQISELERVAKAYSEQSVNPGTSKVIERVTKLKNPNPSPTESLAGRDATAGIVTQVRAKMAVLQNQVAYRIICYRQLGQQAEYDDAMKILRERNPALAADLDRLLK